MPAKYLFVRILRGTDDLSKNTKKHYIVWFSCVAGCTLFSYVIARYAHYPIARADELLTCTPSLNSAIPVFGGLVGLIGALLGSILCLSMESAMWFYDFFSLRKTDKSFKYRALFAWAAFVGFCGIFICGAGVSTSRREGPKNRQLIVVPPLRPMERSKISKSATRPTVVPPLGVVRIVYWVIHSICILTLFVLVGADNSGTI
jgi:hypothetical protein